MSAAKLLLVALLAAQDAQQEVPGGAQDPAAAEGPVTAEEPVYAEEIGAIVEHQAAGQWDLAIVRATRLVEEADELGLDDRRRAEAHFALGLAFAGRAEESADGPGPATAAPSFDSAVALAGPGRIRLDAAYDAGTSHLLEGERWRAKLPEVSGAEDPATQLTPTGPPGPPAPAAGAGEEPDPLVLARGAYLAARERLVERLRFDWRDADTRANLELCQRRLAELDEIERQREEERQRQEQEQEQEPQEGEGEGEGEEQEPSEEEEGSDESDSEPQSSGDPEQQQAGQGEQDTGPQSAPRPEEGEAPPPAAGEGEPTERHLTREEVLRLLERLAEIEDEAEALEALVREARRVPVDRDW